MNDLLMVSEPRIKMGRFKKDGRTNEWKVTCELDQLLVEAKVSKMIMNPTSGTGLDTNLGLVLLE